MIDVRLLRTDLDRVLAAYERRATPGLVDAARAAAALDADAREFTADRERIRGRVNELSREVGRLRRDGDVTAAEALQEESRALGEEEKRIAADHERVAAELRQALLVLPNLPHPDAPDGTGDHDNPMVLGPVEPDSYPDHRRVAHWDIGAELGVLDVERATKISGAMFTMQRGAGATLARALCQFGLDRNADAFEEVRPPTLVLTSTLTATGHLPKFADDAFAIERDDLWCIPTAEVPLTSLYAGEVLDAEQLPVRLMACTPSYRREAGSAGRDTRGMLRTHEFDKVEILALATPDQAPDLLEEMVGRAVGAIEELGLPHRVVEICTGDMGQSHHRSFDVEVYAPGCDQWLEVSSVSWFSDYQARRADVRYKPRDADGKPIKGTEFVHTLNGSALAVPRVWAAILENFREPDGSVVVPEVLRPYMRGIERLGPPVPR